MANKSILRNKNCSSGFPSELEEEITEFDKAVFKQITSTAWMLGFTATSPCRTFTGIIDHDDPREFVYHKEKLLKLAEKEKWAIISMKDNFRTVYGE